MPGSGRDVSRDLDTRLLRFRNRPGSENASELANELLRAGREAEALEVAASGLATSPDEPHLLLVEGQAFFRTGNFLRAQASLLSAARVSPNSAEPLRWLGEVLLKRGDPERAAKVLERAAAIAPRNEDVAHLIERANRLARIAERGGDERRQSTSGDGFPSIPGGVDRRRSSTPNGDGGRRASSPGVPAPPAWMAPPSQRAPRAKNPFEDEDDVPTSVFAENDLSSVLSEALGPSPQDARPAVRDDAPPRRNSSGHLSPPPPAPSFGAAGTVAATWSARPSPPPPGMDAAFTDLPDLSWQGAPPNGAAPESPAEDMAVGDTYGQADDPDAILRMLERQGIFEPPSGRVATWADRKEVERDGTRVGRSLTFLWVIGLLLAGGTYYGWTRWVEHRHTRATKLVTEARNHALAGDHEDLVDAERKLRLARDMHPLDKTGPALLLFVQAQRALEDGAFEPGYLRPTIQHAKKLGVNGAWLAAAQGVLAAADGNMSSTRRLIGTALRDDGRDAGIRYIVGRLEQRLGDDAALTHLAEAAQQSGSPNASAIALAEARADEGQRDEALRLLDGLLQRSPKHLRARLWRVYIGADELDPEEGLRQVATLAERLDRGAPTDRVLVELTRARLLRRKGDSAQAASSVEKAVAAGATEPRLLALVAAEAKAVGKLVRAQTAATAALEHAPTNAEFRKLLAEIQIERRDGVRALSTLSPLTAEDPDVLRMSAEAALLVGTDRALEAASTALAQYVERHQDASVELKALLYRTQSRISPPAPVLAKARTLMAEAPGDPSAARAVGEVALAARDGRTARDALQRYADAAPNDADAFFLLGRANRIGGDAQGAEQGFRRALTLQPEHAEARVALGYLLLDAGKYAEADTLYQDLARRSGAVSGVPLSTIGRVGRVEALVGLGRLDDATVQLQGVRESARTSTEARIAAGRLAIARNQPGEAVQQLRPIAEGENASVDLRALFGDALFAAGEIDAATTQYDNALADDAGHPEALIGRAQVAVRAEKGRDALRHAEDALRSLQQRVRPSSLRARALVLKGRAHLLNGRGEKETARDVLREASQIQGAPSEVWFYLGEALSGENAPESRAAYERYLEIQPNGPYAARARRAIRSAH